MTFAQSLGLVIFLCIVIPAGMYVISLFPLVSVGIFGILLLSLLVFLSSKADA
jgi:hypothetical protein